MPELKGQDTHRNLKQAFAEESSTGQRYLYYAKIADIEGYPDVAQTFRELAEGGIQYAHGHLDFLTTVGDPRTDLPVGETDRNLQAAISAEVADTTALYPDLARIAYEEGFPDIANWFENVGRIKAWHVGRLKDLLDKLEARQRGISR